MNVGRGSAGVQDGCATGKGNSITRPAGLGQGQKIHVSRYHGVNNGVLSSLKDPAVRMFQYPILVLDFAWTNPRKSAEKVEGFLLPSALARGNIVFSP